MGLLGEIKAFLRDVAAVDAFFHPNAPVVQRGDTRASLCDHLTRHMTLDRDRLWTLQGLSKKLCQSVNRQAQTAVLSCDDRRFVPKLKAEEQADRAEGRAKGAAKKGKEEATPYPADAHFVEHGIAYMVEGEGEAEEGIDLNRLSLSRWYGSPTDPARCSNLGNTLWHDMHSDLQDFMTNRCDIGQDVIFHHDAKLGPVHFTLAETGDGSWGAIRQEGLYPDHGPLGEADTDLLRWTRKFDGDVDAIDWYTCDSDLIALYCLYHNQRTEAQRARTRIWWHCDADSSVDLARLVELALRKDHLCDDDLRRSFTSAEAMGLFFILCGNDFIKHKAYAHGCGFDKMLMAFLREELVVTQDTPVQPVFERWLRRLHLHKLYRKPVLVTGHKKPATPLASIDAIRQKYVAEAPRLAKARKGRQEKAMAKLKNDWMLKMAPARFRQSQGDEEERASALEQLVELQLEANREIGALERKHAEPVWAFPDSGELAWHAAVLQWVYDYWRMASLGVVPKEPVRGGAKRTSPHFAPAAAAAAAAGMAAPTEAASSEQAKRMRFCDSPSGDEED